MIPQTQHTINLLYWNANGLRNKIHEVYDFMIDNHIDVCCVSETHFNSQTRVPSHPDFTLHRLDRETDEDIQRAAGGVAIIVRRNLKHSQIESPIVNVLEAIAIQISLQNNHIDIVSVYLPGGTPNADIQEHYRNDLLALTNKNSSFFILGD